MTESNKSGKSSGKSNKSNGRRRYFRAKGNNPAEHDEQPEVSKDGRLGGRSSAKRSSAQRNAQRQSPSQGGGEPRAETSRNETSRGETARSGGGRAEPQRAEAQRNEATHGDSERSRSSRARTRRTGAARAASGRSNNQRAASAGRQRTGEVESRRARRRRRAGERVDVTETKQESPILVSTLDYDAPLSVGIYTYVSRGDSGERYESKVEHFSSIGRKIEDYGIDLSKLIAEDGTIQLPQMNGKITDWESDEP